MKVEILKYPTEEDWLLCKRVTLNTVSKDSTKMPSDEWKVKLLEAEHSPVRTLNFCIKMIDIPYFVSVHFVRHKFGVEHFVTSQRNDRQTRYDRNKAPQDAPVTHIMYLNAQSLINIAHKRLCFQASKETRELMNLIVEEVLKTNPEFKTVLVPNCVYRGGKCTEFNCCGYNKTINRVRV